MGIRVRSPLPTDKAKSAASDDSSTIVDTIKISAAVAVAAAPAGLHGDSTLSNATAAASSRRRTPLQARPPWGRWIPEPPPPTFPPLGEPPARSTSPSGPPPSPEPFPIEPLAAEPMADEPVATEPMAAEPMAAEPMADEPMADEPM